MGKMDVVKGQILHRKGDRVEALELILKGSVSIRSGEDFALQADNGTILGSFYPAGAVYDYDYVASEDGTLFSYDYNSEEDLAGVIASTPAIAPVMASATMALLNSLADTLTSLHQKGCNLVLDIKADYTDYRNVCATLMTPPEKYEAVEALAEPESPQILSSWQMDLTQAYDEHDEELRQHYYPLDIRLCVGNIMLAGQMARLLQPEIEQQLAFIRETHAATDDFVREYQTQKAKLDEAMRKEAMASGSGELPSIQNAMSTILAFSGVSREIAETFRRDILTFMQIENKMEKSDTMRRLRRSITENFYAIYEAAFYRSLEVEEIPIEVRMFFLFGFVDENLAGAENTAALYKYALLWEDDPERRILTTYSWLRKIYEGEVPPSKNDFDQDWTDCVKEELRTHAITEQEADARMDDRKAMVHFELTNMITSANKMTYGIVFAFIPAFFAQAVTRPLENCFVTPAKVRDALNRVRSIDYSCFYRPTVTSYTQWKINRFDYDVEVLPYIILMPNFGSRGVMWQEIEGRRRTTPSHMILSIFHASDLEYTVLHMCAQFRWEMCKRIQGVHYADVSDPSLTSEYTNYLQFYKKNHDLSADIKEKVKDQLKRHRNGYRDVFIADYETYIQNESGGMSRLNKVARPILFKYCTFSKQYRTALSSNPQYMQLVQRWTTTQASKVQTVGFLRHKIAKLTKEIPFEIDAQIEFLQK